MIAAALFNRFAIGFNRIGVLAAPRERDAEAVISVGIFRLLLNRSAKPFDCAVNVAHVQQRARKLVISARKVALAHLNSHAIAVDSFVEPSFVIKYEAFV